MIAYKCDICGNLFAQPTEINVRNTFPEKKFFAAVLVRSADGLRVDICNDCRLKLEKVIDQQIVKAYEDFEKEWE